MPLPEPYRIKHIEPIPFLQPAERAAALAAVDYNQFLLPADQVTIDLLSDSGTGATSAEQEAAAALGREDYASSGSWFRFKEAMAELTGFEYLLPVHQGRAAERVLFSSVLKPGQIGVSNTHFDTTGHNVTRLGAVPRDLPCGELGDFASDAPFKGNIDLDALQKLLEGPEGSQVGQVVMTITNNGGGGQPVSMANLEATAALCHQHRVPLFLDAARFAENAWLVTQREPGYQDCSPRQVARRAFDLADGCIISLKKDGLSWIGGLIGLRDAQLAEACEDDLIATEGFSTYGGLAGHDLERLAQGVREVLEPAYLRARADHTAYLAALVNEAGVATIQPAGIHGVYLDAGRLLAHLRPEAFPGHALACQLYLDGGIRCSELGSLYLGTLNQQLELDQPAPFELVRLALPRRVYTQSHLEYVAEVLAGIAAEPTRVSGYRILSAPATLRHFRVRLTPVAAS